jgi:hypothetical protein
VKSPHLPSDKLADARRSLHERRVGRSKELTSRVAATFFETVSPFYGGVSRHRCCDGTLASCDASLSACEGSLGACEASLGGCDECPAGCEGSVGPWRTATFRLWR